MSSNLLELFRTNGKIIGNHLPTMVGQPSSSLADAKTFRERVVEPSWNELPLPLRMLGRERLNWDQFLGDIRDAAYDASGAKIAFHADAATRTTEIFQNAGESFEKMIAESLAGEASKQTPQSDADEPGHAIGIDLGTTYSACAFVDQQGRPSSILNSVGEITTPSVVLFDDEGTIVGKEAALAAAMEPERIAICVKRDMGSGSYGKKVNGEYLPPEVISSIILRSIKADAERRLDNVTHAVITVPAYFDESRRQATIDSGRMAGLQVLDIINEPTAAAVSYGYQLGFLDETQSVHGGKTMSALVYDLGGGTFDVTVLEIDGNEFRAIATDGDVRLGGKDWDEKIVEFAAGKFIAEHREDPRENPSSLQDLWIAAETAKKTLTERPKANVFINHIGVRMKVEITRAEFEEATVGLLNRTRQTTEIVLRQASLKWDDIDRALMVGGSTRMPAVAQMLEEISGKEVDRSLSPDEAVAHGAALYANLLMKKGTGRESKGDFKLTNVNSHSLGIIGLDKATKRKINHIVIPKNTPLPHSIKKVFTTARENQPNVKVEILEGESARPEYCTSVGKAIIRDLPKTLPAGSPIEVKYKYEENGQLSVTAKLKGHESQVVATFARDNNLPENDLMAWSEYIAHESRAMS